jgi:hypothetical protein
MSLRPPSSSSGAGGAVRRSRLLVAVTAGFALAASAVLAPAASATPTPPKGSSTTTVRGDVREVKLGKTYSTKGLATGAQRRAAARSTQASGTAPVGTTRELLALDDYNGKYYTKPYTLQAVGDHIEVWVADDNAFPAGDCRNAVAGSTTVTRAQAQSLVSEFDSNMFPKESAAFSVAPDRDGSKKDPAIGAVDPSGDGDKIMTLVDNVRDDNYYEGPAKAPTYVAGFFSSQINELFDRNVMTIDAFDWLHRTGADPADASTSDVCTSRPARPRLYEGTFAHEYQHLLEYYQDPSETSWVNEGLSDFAQTLVGYVDATKTVSEPAADSHIYCYQGFGTVKTEYNPNPRDCGGPENSLTLWGDQPPAAGILADYGIAYSFMLYLYDHYGLEFMSALHRDGDNQGLLGLQDQLDRYAKGVDAYQALHRFQVATLVDRYIGVKGGTIGGIVDSKVTSKSLSSTVNLDNPAAYARPGAPANGADFVGLRAGTGLYLKGKDLRSLSFTGSKALAPEPLRWTSVSDAPGRAGNPTLWSGNEDNLDASAVVPVTVPTADPTLTYTERHLAEATYDYAYTVVSTDGGKSYTPLANANTVKGPQGPALNGDADKFTTQTFDLRAYAGKKVLIGFRYVSDGGTNDGGWWVDDVKVGSTLVSDGSKASVFGSSTQVYPVKVGGWEVKVVGLDTAKHKGFVKFYDRQSFTLSRSDLKKFSKYARVVAIVSYDEPTEQYQPQALYTLTVNKVVQPGGGQSDGKAVTVKADRF